MDQNKPESPFNIDTEKLKQIRQAAKRILFHDKWCQYPKTATCTCGREPFYSPEKRKERGEIK